MRARRVYTPDSLARKPRELLAGFVRDLRGSLPLARRLLARTLHVRHRQSLLGFTWAFVPPIAMALGFTLARGSGVLAVGDTEIPYPVYVLLSTALWQTFLDALNAPIQTVQAARPMLARVPFPREALLLSGLGEVGFQLAIRLVLVAVTFALFGVGVPATVVLAPLALLVLVALGTALGVLLAPLGLLYNDVARGITLLSGVWLFLTPVVYPMPVESGAFATLVRLNPVTPLLVTARDLATSGALTQPLGFAIVTALVLVALVPALLAHRLALPFAIERLSS